MTLKFNHWVIASIIASSIHIGFAYLFFMAPPVTQGAKAEGVGGLEISISMVAAAIGAEPQKKVEAVQDQIMTPEPVTKPVEAKEVKVDPVVIPINKIKPVIKAPKKIVQKKKPPVKTKKITKKEANLVKKIQKPQQQVIAKKSQGTVRNAPKANRLDKLTKKGGGKVVGTAHPDYITTLRHWLEKHKTYPKSAKRRRQQGIVILSFSVTREGLIAKSKIIKSSGYEILDNETHAMLNRAQPLPKFPNNMQGEVLNLTLPVQFALK